jgi:hypothetical protein
MIRRIGFGFLAGALAVVVLHQFTVLLLHQAGAVPNFPWSMRAVGPYSVPAILNQMFWGGLWGIGFALVGHLIPIRNWLARGAAYGVLGPWLLGNGLLVPYFRGGTYLFGLQPSRMWIGFLIQIGFGIGLAVFQRLLDRVGR